MQGDLTKTQMVCEIMERHLREHVPASLLKTITDCAMVGIREAKPIIAEIIKADRSPSPTEGDADGK